MSSAELQAAQGRMGEQWTEIDWTACLRTVRSLQRRIVKSIHTGHWRKVKRLCYLLVHSFAARALAVKQVTENKGKKTAGIDGTVWSTPGQKMEAVRRLVKKLIRIDISKFYQLLSVSQCLCILPQMRLRIG